MCRNIKNLFNFDPPSTEEEIRGAAIQFVRKVSGFQKPSKVNEAVFNSAVQDVSLTLKKMLAQMETNSKPRNREVEAALAKERSIKRFGNGKEN